MGVLVGRGVAVLVAVLVAVGSSGCSVSVAVGSVVGSVVAVGSSVAVGRGVLVGRRVAVGSGSLASSMAISAARSCWETAVASGSSELGNSVTRPVRPQQVTRMPAAAAAMILRGVRFLTLG